MASNLICGKCNTWFEDGVCPNCGASQNAKQQRRQKSQALKTASIARDIQANPRAAQAKEMVAQLFADYGLKGDAIMRNRKRGYCTQYNDGSYGLILSWQNIGKFQEYPTFAWLWDWNAREMIEGPKATWAYIIHEFAHVLQFEAGGVYGGKGGHHNSIFVQKVQELQELYPYNA